MERESEMKTSKFKRICVFCGSSHGKKISYQEAAINLAKVLVCMNVCICVWIALFSWIVEFII